MKDIFKQRYNMRKIYIVLTIITILFVQTILSDAHSGRTDKNGCHHNRKTGDYHCHNVPIVTSTPTPTPIVTYTSTPTPTPIVTYTSTPTPTPIVTYTSTPTPTPIVTSPVLDRIVTVISVIDGDTIYIDHKEKVRLVGINTPDIGETGYVDAKSFVENRIIGKQIYLDVDDKNIKDKYDRTLAVININGENLNKELLCKGYAKVMYIPPSEFDPNDWKSSCSDISVTTVITPMMYDTNNESSEVTETVPTEIIPIQTEVTETVPTEIIPIRTSKSSGYNDTTIIIILAIYLLRKGTLLK